MIVAAVMAVLWLAGWLLLSRPPRCGNPAGQTGFRSLSIIIPARNEEKNLPALLASIQAQPIQPLEVWAIDDDSQDATAAIANRLGARVIHSKPLPEGWIGKTWACRQGALAAQGELLLFMDADTRFEPGGLSRLLGAWQQTGGVVSVAPYHEVRRPYEHGSVYF